MTTLETAATLLPFRPFLRDVATLVCPVDDDPDAGLSIDLSAFSQWNKRSSVERISLFLAVAALRWGTTRLNAVNETDAAADVMSHYRLSLDQMILLYDAVGPAWYWRDLPRGSQTKAVARAVRLALKGVQF